MSRIILFLLLIAALIAVGTIIATAFGKSTAPVPAKPRVGGIQKIAFVLLMAVTIGVGSGWMGAD